MFAKTKFHSWYVTVQEYSQRVDIVKESEKISFSSNLSDV